MHKCMHVCIYIYIYRPVRLPRLFQQTAHDAEFTFVSTCAKVSPFVTTERVLWTLGQVESRGGRAISVGQWGPSANGAKANESE